MNESTGHDVSIGRSSIDSLDKYRSLYQACFPANTHLRIDYLSWLYGKNPNGALVGADAWCGDMVVGQVAAIPGEYLLHGQPARGLLAVNVAVHPRFQGRLLFKKLGLQMCEYGRQAGYDFVIGVANAAATPGWIRHMDFQLVGPLEAKIGVGPLDIDAALAARKVRFQRVWSDESLAWRCANPNNPVFHRHRGERMQFYAAAKGTLLPAYAELPSHSLPATGRAPERFLSPWRLYIGLVPGMACTFRRYVSIPRRMRPSPLNFIYRPLSDRVRTLEKEHISFSFLDFDAY